MTFLLVNQIADIFCAKDNVSLAFPLYKIMIFFINKFLFEKPSIIINHHYLFQQIILILNSFRFGSGF
jgi:hypothetical protein